MRTPINSAPYCVCALKRGLHGHGKAPPDALVLVNVELRLKLAPRTGLQKITYASFFPVVMARIAGHDTGKILLTDLTSSRVVRHPDHLLELIVLDLLAYLVRDSAQV